MASPFLIAQRRGKEDQIQKTEREFMHWLLAQQAHLVSSLILELLDMSKGPPIVLGDYSLTESLGKGRIDIDHGKFNNVLYVPGLASNLLSVY